MDIDIDPGQLLLHHEKMFLFVLYFIDLTSSGLTSYQKIFASVLLLKNGYSSSHHSYDNLQKCDASVTQNTLSFHLTYSGSWTLVRGLRLFTHMGKQWYHINYS